ncbi:hypothetical protein WME76_02270 [Sorangium sp. So ce119]|uniref:hypothetical protein n=1 Tax=Sorangium sp. So ce119 TaxID=3133279 RepID=UPI003F5EEF21
MIHGDARELVAEERETLSSAARVRVRCAPRPDRAPDFSDVCVSAVLEDGTEVPLRGVTAVRFHVVADAPAVGEDGGVELSVRFIDFETDVQARAKEERS